MLIDCLHNIVGGGFKRIIWKMTKKIIDLMWRHAAKLLRRTRDAGTTLWSQICLGEWDDIGFLNVMVGLEYGYGSISNKSSSICEVDDLAYRIGGSYVCSVCNAVHFGHCVVQFVVQRLWLPSKNPSKYIYINSISLFCLLCLVLLDFPFSMRQPE